jgi:surface antigen
MRIVAAVMAASLLVGCANSNAPGEYGANKTAAGGLLGAIGGAVAGAQFGKGKGQLVGVAAGTLIGALLGSEVGRSLDKADLAYANRAQAQAGTAPIGQTIVWTNPETGNRGTVTPTREGRVPTSGEYCREYQNTVQIGGRGEQSYGTACRQPDGSWRVVQQ